MDFLCKQVDLLREYMTSQPPEVIFAAGLFTGIVVFYSKRFLSIGQMMKLARSLPGVEGIIQKELEAQLNKLREDVVAQNKGKAFVTTLPEEGWSKEAILTEIQELLDMADFKAKDGAFSGICHQPSSSAVDVVTKAYTATAYTNPLNPDAYPGIRKMEAEVVRITGNLFHAGEEMQGTMTSGGTESLLLSVLAYRGFGRETRGITKPNLVMPVSGHVAFDKAGHILGVEVRHVPVHPQTLAPSVEDFKKYIDRNTIMLVGSAPSYAHGIMDPIEGISQLGLKLGIPVHVDACLGGFLLAFAESIGYAPPPFDFRLEGNVSFNAKKHMKSNNSIYGLLANCKCVTSMSADTHKFGYAPKGSSVIMYKNKKYIHHQYFVSPDWSGGIFVSPTLAGSRSGGIIAATWAALIHHGQDGYRKATKAILNTAADFKDGISKIDGLDILGHPELCIIAFASKKFHIYLVADAMKERGWLLSCIQNPTAVHLYVVPSHTQSGIVDKFLKDLRDSVKHVATLPPGNLTGRAAVYGMAQQIPDRSLVADLGANFLDTLYSTRE